LFLLRVSAPPRRLQQQRTTTAPVHAIAGQSLCAGLPADRPFSERVCGSAQMAGLQEPMFGTGTLGR
jgi:hypothetical protein